MLSMAASKQPRHTSTVFRRHVPPAQVPLLKNSAFDLMTRPAFIPRVPAERKQFRNRRDARRTGNFVRPLRSVARPRTTTAPALGPGHKLGGIREAPRLAVVKHRNGCVGDVDGDPTVRSSMPPYHPPPTVSRGAMAFSHGASRQLQARSRNASGRWNSELWSAGLDQFVLSQISDNHLRTKVGCLLSPPCIACTRTQVPSARPRTPGYAGSAVTAHHLGAHT